MKTRPLFPVGIFALLFTLLYLAFAVHTSPSMVHAQIDPSATDNIYVPLVSGDNVNSTVSASSVLTPSPNWEYEINQAGALLGVSASDIGDVNGDGFHDFATGALYYTGGQHKEGKVFVFYGSSTGLALSPDWTVESNVIEPRFGVGLSGAGDVNGDGYDDLLVGAYNYSNGQIAEGKLFLYYGSASGLSSTADWTYESNIANHRLGYSVASAGDINADGYADIIAGNVPGTSTGYAYAFYGSSTGLGTTPDWSAGVMPSVGLWNITVNSAGDVNGDTYDDVIVGNMMAGPNNPGYVYVFHGSSSGLSTSQDWFKAGGQNGGSFGRIVGASDFDADGYSDIYIGASAQSNGENSEGIVYVYKGSSTGLSSSHDWSAESNQAGAQLGVSGATGDHNGDGYDDLLLGAYGYDAAANNVGKAYLFEGSSSGLLSTSSWSVEGDQSGGELGSSAALADVASDGKADIFVGQYYYEDGETNEGRTLGFYSQLEAITGLTITHTTPLQPDISSSFTATVATGENVTYQWEFTPIVDAITATSAIVSPTFTIRYNVLVTATNATNIMTATKQVTLE